jgi:hypothetical protein
MNCFFYRKQNLVFVSLLKCASTYYGEVFVNNGWKPIAYNTIDWVNDHVFGFIMNPTDRYLKGLAEDVLDPTTCWNVENLPVFVDSMVVTYHSLPINSYLSKNMKEIDWIPLDTSVSSEELVLKLLQQYNLTLHFDDTINKHQSNAGKTKIYNLLKSNFDLNNHVIHAVLQEDNDLYSQVCNNINLNGKTWEDISWLKQR